MPSGDPLLSVGQIQSLLSRIFLNNDSSGSNVYRALREAGALKLRTRRSAKYQPFTSDELACISLCMLANRSHRKSGETLQSLRNLSLNSTCAYRGINFSYGGINFNDGINFVEATANIFSKVSKSEMKTHDIDFKLNADLVMAKIIFLPYSQACRELVFFSKDENLLEDEITRTHTLHLSSIINVLKGCVAHIDD